MTLREHVLATVAAEHGSAGAFVLDDESWARTLREAAESCAADEVIVADAASRDHVEAVSRADGLPRPARGVGSLELAAAADACGLSLCAFVPYGALLGGDDANRWLEGSRLWGYLGERALSWIDVDERLFAFAGFVERRVVGLFSTAGGSRYAAVFAKRLDPATTAATLAANRPQDVRRADLAEEVRRHLRYPRNRALAAMALCAPAAYRIRDAVEALAGAAYSAELFGGYERERADEAVQQLLLQLRGPAFVIEGVDVSAALAYDFTRDLLERTYFSVKGAP